MSRKTVDVEYVKMFANLILADEHPGRAQERLGVIVLLEAILFETGNYKGFRYLPHSGSSNGSIRIEQTLREYF